ncbi:MAG: F0F1 ATP synthase subunit alpha [Patescibacteria group bacterium]
MASNKTPGLEDIIKSIENDLNKWDLSAKIEQVGTVVRAGDGITEIYGLKNVASNEMIEFASGVKGLALNLDNESVGAIVLGDFTKIAEGESVKATGKILQVPVGEAMIGRVVNGVAEPVDGKGEIKATKFYPVERIASGVISRQSVDQPLQTGVKAIDAMIPIGRGQRELIIGDRQTGKTQIALDTIVNQKGENVICVYVAIGQKQAKIARIVEELKKRGAMDYTIVVASSATDPASLNYLAPYTGCAIAEYFMDKGQDALVVYDDLSKHAVAYRQISLLLRRPPGREAYPGDVFYLHSRLLERSCKLNKDFGGGSITALPIIETQGGDVSAYIPTNVISITDGQIYLETDLFYQGIRPALNVGLSVSRVGSSAQTKAMKKVAGTLRLELAQYRELASFAQFGSDLDEGTLNRIERGKRLTEVLKQKQFSTLSFSKQVMVLFAGTNGLLDDIQIEHLAEFEKNMYEFMDEHHARIEETIAKEKDLSDSTKEGLKKAVAEFKNKRVPQEWMIAKNVKN